MSTRSSSVTCIGGTILEPRKTNAKTDLHWVMEMKPCEATSTAPAQHPSAGSQPYRVTLSILRQSVPRSSTPPSVVARSQDALN